MTHEEFEKVIPRKTIVSIQTEEGKKNLLVKFFVCDREKFDGYWMCCTEDFSNPYPSEFRDDDWRVYANSSEIVRY